MRAATTELLVAVEDRTKKRDDIAMAYARELHGESLVDWPAVNAAVIERWSRSGLSYIKKRAWRIYEVVA